VTLIKLEKVFNYNFSPINCVIIADLPTPTNVIRLLVALTSSWQKPIVIFSKYLKVQAQKRKNGIAFASLILVARTAASQ